MLRRSLAHLGLIQGHEIDGFDHQGRHAAVTHHIGHDAAGKGKQHVRRLDQQDRLHRFLGDVLQPEEPGIGQFQQEELAGVALGMHAQLEFHLEMHVVAAPGLDVDPEIDLRPFRQAGRRAGILERQVLDILAHHLEVGGEGRAFALAGDRGSVVAHTCVSIDRGPRATMMMVP